MMNTVEQWRPLRDAGTLLHPLSGAIVPEYEVSDHGRVRSWKVAGGRSTGTSAEAPRILQGNQQRYGHTCYTLRLAGKSVYRFGHRMVVDTFAGGCPEHMEVLHKNGDAADNRLSNLRVASRTENAHDRAFHARHGKGIVRRGAPVFLTESERRQLLTIRDAVQEMGIRGADLLTKIATAPHQFGRVRDNHPLTSDD